MVDAAYVTSNSNITAPTKEGFELSCNTITNLVTGLNYPSSGNALKGVNDRLPTPSLTATVPRASQERSLRIRPSSSTNCRSEASEDDDECISSYKPRKETCHTFQGNVAEDNASQKEPKTREHRNTVAWSAASNSEQPLAHDAVVEGCEELFP